jgi:hypothetical protein
MLCLTKKNNSIVYEYEKKHSCQNINRMSPNYIPIRINKKTCISYDSWLYYFSEEIDVLVEYYINMFISICHRNGKICSFDIEKLKSELTYKIYKTSFNRYKYYRALI